MGKLLTALVKNSPVALVVIGLAFFGLGAAGGWSSVFVVKEPGFQIAMMIVGGIVAAWGIILLWRGGLAQSSAHTPPAHLPRARVQGPRAQAGAPQPADSTEQYGIKIVSATKSGSAGKNLSVVVTCDKRPANDVVALFSVGPTQHYYFRGYVYFPNDKSWSGEIIGIGNNLGQKTIIAVVLDRAGQALANY